MEQNSFNFLVFILEIYMNSDVQIIFWWWHE